MKHWIRSTLSTWFLFNQTHIIVLLLTTYPPYDQTWSMMPISPMVTSRPVVPRLVPCLTLLAQGILGGAHGQTAPAADVERRHGSPWEAGPKKVTWIFGWICLTYGFPWMFRRIFRWMFRCSFLGIKSSGIFCDSHRLSRSIQLGYLGVQAWE